MTRVLVITYYWPPAGGPGVQRWLQFVKNFNHFGIEPVVYIPENPHYPLIDPSFVKDVPKNLEILKLPVNEPYKLAGFFSKKKMKQISSGIITQREPSFLEKLMLFVRGNFFIPDARAGWVEPSVSFLKKYLNENPVDAIISSGPPHSLHLIGMKLQKDTGTKWIADFRDPWTTIHYHKSLRLTKTSERRHKKLESEVLTNADQVVVTSPTTKREFEMITDTPINVITNGFAATEDISAPLDPHFSIAHIGSLLSERNPMVLWEVLSELVSENASFSADLRIELAGAVSDDVIASLKRYGLIELTDLMGYISHSEALKKQHSAQVLLLVEIDSQETRSIIPGKLFEYLAARRPIVALGPSQSDIEDIIIETNSGHFFTPHQDKKLKNTILEHYQKFKDGSLAVDSVNVEKYSRKELTGAMSSVINEVVKR